MTSAGLLPFFGDMLADQFNTDEIERWKRWRFANRLRKSSRPDQDKLMPASINRELAILRRGFQLGYERTPQLVEKIPPIKKLGENNIRTGFISPEQFPRLMAELPSHLQDITSAAFTAGNRKGELFRLEWEDVELEVGRAGLIRWPSETKNNDGHYIPLDEGEEFLDRLRTLKAEHDLKWPNQARVFLTPEGEPLKHHHMRKQWDNACIRAGLPGLLFHDLRRSAVRNTVRGGVSPVVAQRLSGHKTMSMFNRYNITDETDLREAAHKRAQYLKKG